MPTANTPVLPVQTLSASILQVPSTVIVQLFADRVFVTVTQLNKFGCLYQASTSTDPSTNPMPDDSASADPDAFYLPPPLPSTSITKLVGTEPSPAHAALYELYVSQIASILRHCSPTESRPLIVSLALQPTKRPALGKDAHSDDDDDEDGLLMHSNERERFLGIMQLVHQCFLKIR